MGQEDDVGLVAHDGRAEAHVGLEQAREGWLELAERAEVPAVEDGRLEVGAGWVVEPHHGLQRGLVADGLILADGALAGVI